MSSSVTIKDNTVLYVLAATVVAAAFLVKDHKETPYDSLFEEIGPQRNVEPALLKAITRVESSFDPRAYRNEGDGRASRGLMQILSTTARALGITNLETLYDPRTNIKAGAALLDSLRKELGTVYSLDTWIASYNAGSPAIIRRGIFNFDYVSKVKEHYYLYKVGGNV